MVVDQSHRADRGGRFVAVDLVLESGLPSAEHIENMLNRLKSGPLPPPVER